MVSKGSYILKVRKCREKVRLAKILTGLDILKDMKTKGRRFFSYVNKKRMRKE